MSRISVAGFPWGLDASDAEPAAAWGRSIQDISSHSSWEEQLLIGAAEGPAEARVDGCRYLLVSSCKASGPM